MGENSTTANIFFYYSSDSRTVTLFFVTVGISGFSSVFRRIFFENLTKIAKCNSPGVTTVKNEKSKNFKMYDNISTVMGKCKRSSNFSSRKK